MPKEILVVYYSRSGNTRKVAQGLAARLDADLWEIKDSTDRSGLLNWFRAGRDAMKKRPTEISGAAGEVGGYKLVVAGTPVWCWTLAPAVRVWLEKNRGSFAKTAFFSCSGGKAAKTVRDMEESAASAADCSESFFDPEIKNDAVLGPKLDAFANRIKQQL